MIPRVIVPESPNGIADSVNSLADGRPAGLRERGRIQVGRVDLQHREIVAAVDADDGGLEIAFVGERHFNALRVVDDVIIGQDVALRYSG